MKILRHYRLSDFGIKKGLRADFDPRDAEEALALVVSDLAIEKARSSCGEA